MSPPVNRELDHILAAIQDLRKENREDHERLWGELTGQGKELAGLKVKAGIWGSIAGCIPLAVVGMALFIRQLLKGDAS